MSEEKKDDPNDCPLDETMTKEQFQEYLKLMYPQRYEEKNNKK